MCTAFLETVQHDEKNNHSGEMMFLLDDSSDMFEEKDKKGEKRNEVWRELKANLQEIEKPRNVLLIGGLGTGKSSFINTVLTALTGKHRYCANIGSGNRHNSTRLQK